jgi:predicted secreted protein
MALSNIKGRDLGLYVQKTDGSTLTWVLIGCATDVSLDVDTETDETSCAANGKYKSFEDGQITWTAAASLNVRQADGADASANITSENLLDIQLGDTNRVQLRYQVGIGTGSARYAGDAIITKSSYKGQQKGVATFSCSFQGTGELVKTLVPA